jgi:hypothetical protein
VHCREAQSATTTSWSTTSSTTQRRCALRVIRLACTRECFSNSHVMFINRPQHERAICLCCAAHITSPLEDLGVFSHRTRSDFTDAPTPCTPRSVFRVQSQLYRHMSTGHCFIVHAGTRVDPASSGLCSWDRRLLDSVCALTTLGARWWRSTHSSPTSRPCCPC